MDIKRIVFIIFGLTFLSTIDSENLSTYFHILRKDLKEIYEIRRIYFGEKCACFSF